MSYILVRQKVEDYAKWKDAFDRGAEDHRRAAGSKGGYVFRDADDPLAAGLKGKGGGLDVIPSALLSIDQRVDTTHPESGFPRMPDPLEECSPGCQHIFHDDDLTAGADVLQAFDPSLGSVTLRLLTDDEGRKWMAF